VSGQVAASLDALSGLLRPDPGAVVRAFAGVSRGFTQLGESMRRAGKTLRLLTEACRRVANDEARVSGLEMRMLVLGGYLGTHVEGDVDGHVLALMTDPPVVTGDTVDRLLTTASRARLAAALIRGHAAQTSVLAGPVAMHRHWPLGDVYVGRAG
jgi:hypothetical protein